MCNRFDKARAILTMDANAAMDTFALAHLGLFRRHPLLMHTFAISAIVTSFVVMWRIGGFRIALIVTGLPFALMVLTVLVMRVRHSLRRD